LERWSVERAADRQSLGSGLAVVGKRIGHRSRLSGRKSTNLVKFSLDYLDNYQKNIIFAVQMSNLKEQ